MKYYNSKNKKIILGFIAGASIGALAAILLSPGKGADTRKKIINKTGDWGIALKDSISDFLRFNKKSSSKRGYEKEQPANMNLNTMG